MGAKTGIFDDSLKDGVLGSHNQEDEQENLKNRKKMIKKYK